MKFSALPSLFRIHNAFFGTISVITSVLLINPDKMFRILLLGIISYVTLSSAGNVINDIYDIAIDKINRPKRPIPSGKITKCEAKITFILLLLAGLSASLYSSFLISNPLPFIVAAIFAGMGVLYSAKLKIMGFIGNIAVAVSFSIGYIYGVVICDPSLFLKVNFYLFNFTSPVFSIFLFFITSTALLVSREIIKGIEDIEGDRKRDVKTLARTIGVKRSVLVAFLFGLIAVFSYTALLFLSGFQLFLLPFIISGDLSAIFSSILILFGRQYASKSSFFSKIAMFIGLTGFFLVALF